MAEDERWMRRALELAGEGERLGEVPVGAVLVRDGREIGAGFNRPIEAHDPTAHAEIVALRAAASNEGNYRLPGATLYVTIEPCTMCVGAIVHARVSRLVFGAREPKAGAIVSSDRLLERPAVNWRVEIDEGVLADACADKISTFFRQRRALTKASKLSPGQDGNEQHLKD